MVYLTAAFAVATLASFCVVIWLMMSPYRRQS